MVTPKTKAPRESPVTSARVLDELSQTHEQLGDTLARLLMATDRAMTLRLEIGADARGEYIALLRALETRRVDMAQRFAEMMRTLARLRRIVEQ